MWLFFLFVAVPLIEIALFIQLGGFIGLWPTLLIVVLTAMLGTWLVRNQGIMAMGNVRSSFQNLQNPAEPLAHGAMILVAGALLLTPGFFTDAVGFSLLVPFVRTAVFNYAKSRVNVQSFAFGDMEQSQKRNDSPIDAYFEDITHKKQPTHEPSGWTKH